MATKFVVGDFSTGATQATFEAAVAAVQAAGGTFHPMGVKLSTDLKAVYEYTVMMPMSPAPTSPSQPNSSS